MHSLDDLRSGALAGARHLRLSCGLRTFPPEIFTLADTLEVLDLSGNALSALPDDLPRLHRLRILFCSDNLFTVLPAVLGQCPQLSMVGFKANRIHTVPAAALPPALRWLILTDNRLNELPAALGRCSLLQKLMLSGNRLQTLPRSMAACTRLELLRIAANQFSALPNWLLGLPRLSWLAFAGNPMTAAAEADALAHTPARAVPWSALQTQHTLGEGASGVIHQAAWQPAEPEGDHPREVAVKLFKGAVTSDGLPDSEMAACLRAGAHPSLIPLLGKVSAHPHQAQGLVMALIAPAFTVLAGPPSLASCTRDVYAAGMTFELPTALQTAIDMASVAAHAHAQGLLHGDLYAHNILRRADGHALLGDFGAASLTTGLDPSTVTALQRLEVRAFACLLQELLERCPPTDRIAPSLQELAHLQARCDQEDVAARPLFADIHRSLLDLQRAAASAARETEPA